MMCTYKLGVDPLPLLREPQRVSACLDVHGGQGAWWVSGGVRALQVPMRLAGTKFPGKV